MSNGTEELIRSIAEKTGVMLTKNDPILLLFHANMHLLSEQTQEQENMLRQFASTLQESQQLWNEEAKKQSSKAITAAIQAAVNEMDKLAEQRTNKVTEGIAEILKPTIQKFSADVNRSNMVGMLNIAASGLTLAAVAIAVLFYRF